MSDTTAVKQDHSLRNIAMVVAGALAIFWLYPLLAESASSTCSALEKAHYSGPNAAGPSILPRLTDGQLAEIEARKEFPNVPPGIGCALMYWRDEVFNRQS